MRSSSPGQTYRTNSTLWRLENTHWLRSTENDSDYSVLVDLTETECQQSCLNDCMCFVVIYDNAVCTKKQLPLFDGRQAVEINSTVFVKVSDDFNLQSPEQSKETEGKTLVFIGIAVDN
ncbi:hypothetical protein SUGI_0018910 [Cryptomeria japonica]|nr:hypothetical protein SUGI_0018910 [Cryptomeria japonica]